MKTFSTILLVAVVLVGGCSAAVMWMTAPVRVVGDGFFEAWGRGQPQQAYPYLSQAFKAATSADQLNQFMAQARLNQKLETSWSQRSINNDQGRLVGTLTRADGTEVNVDVTLAKEAGLWKIVGMNFSTPNPSLPSIAQSNGYGPAGPATRSGGGERPAGEGVPVKSVAFGPSTGAP